MKAINSGQSTDLSIAGAQDLLARAAAVGTRATVGRLARIGVVAADGLAVVAAMVLVARIGHLLPTDGASAGPVAYTTVCAVALPLWLVTFARYRLYHARHITTRRDELQRVLHAVGISVVVTAVVAYALGKLVPRSWLVALFVAGVAVLAVEREVVRHAFNVLRRRGHCLRHVVIAGTGNEAVALAAMLEEQPELGYRVVGLLGRREEADERLREYGPVLDVRNKVAEQVRMAGASGVLVATTDVDLETSNRLARVLTDAGIHVELSSSLKDIDATRLAVRPLGRFPVLYVEPVRRGGWHGVAKRAFDVTFALFGLVVSAPILAVAAVAIKATSPGPVVFKQERVGRRGRRFHVLKLRTMVCDAESRIEEIRLLNEADGPLFKVREDPRVTRVGRVLRKLSIDELPQLWNVVRGEMSLVGPRPALPSEVTQWGPELFERLRVQPGITGMWQVRGRSDSSFSQYQRWDLYYVDNWSIAHDIGIILRTVPVVLSQKGAY
ncbi:MAG: sugar transferase [Actinobacteria bacterium]|nr:sugar transferase [Actinomycetota bacterium]